LAGENNSQDSARIARIENKILNLFRRSAVVKCKTAVKSRE